LKSPDFALGIPAIDRGHGQFYAESRAIGHPRKKSIEYLDHKTIGELNDEGNDSRE
jgi:hypothetical protein